MADAINTGEPPKRFQSTVTSILFTNHLPLGSASSYRQAGLAKYLRAAGFETRCLCRAGGSAPRDARGLSTEWPQYHDIRYWREPLVPALPANAAIFRESAKEDTIVLINRANPYTSTVAMLGRRKGTPLIVDMEDWDGYGGYSSYVGAYGPKGLMLTFFENLFPRQGSLVLAVSHLLYSRMAALGVPKERLLYLPNGYDDDLFDPSIAGTKVRDRFSLGDSPVVIYMSTFWKFERELHRTALDAFRMVLEEQPRAKMLMLGRGDLSVDSLIAERGLGGSVIKTGFISRRELAQFISAADVALHVISSHPYHQASSPMVVSEYMAMEKPVVAPRVGELAYALGDGAGLLVDRVEPRLLAEGVTRLLSDGGAREKIGRRARERARKEYSYARLAERLRSRCLELSG